MLPPADPDPFTEKLACQNMPEGYSRNKVSRKYFLVMKTFYTLGRERAKQQGFPIRLRIRFSESWAKRLLGEYPRTFGELEIRVHTPQMTIRRKPSCVTAYVPNNPPRFSFGLSVFDDLGPLIAIPS